MSFALLINATVASRTSPMLADSAVEGAPTICMCCLRASTASRIACFFVKLRSWAWCTFGSESNDAELEALIAESSSRDIERLRKLGFGSPVIQKSSDGRKMTISRRTVDSMPTALIPFRSADASIVVGSRLAASIGVLPGAHAFAIVEARAPSLALVGGDQPDSDRRL